MVARSKSSPSTAFLSATLTLVMSGRGAMSGCGGFTHTHCVKHACVLDVSMYSECVE